MSTNESIDLAQVRAVFAKSVHDHWVLYLIEGLVLLGLGVAAIILPVFATLSITLVIGWILLASGILGLMTSFIARQAPGFWWSLISALLAIVAGLLLVAWPSYGAYSLTIILIAFFIIEGLTSIMFGFEHRPHVSTWSWMVASGIVDLLLATILFLALPGAAAWALGLLVGINMIFGGAALAAIAIQAHRSDPGGTMRAA
jgi:uncharacterized membrane protein HdeD (DUF308 family)